jgi:YgiT-type zinc finger domain-containing protein
MKRCPFCKGNIKEAKIDHLHRWGKEIYLFENVVAEVCSQCGETFFAPVVLELMDKHVKEKLKADKTVTIPVIKLKERAIA